MCPSLCRYLSLRRCLLQLAYSHSLGYLEGEIYKERLILPELLVNVRGRWRAPHTACCTVKKNRYLCCCDVFEVETPICGLNSTQDNQNSKMEEREPMPIDAEALCPIPWTRWRSPRTKLHITWTDCIALSLTIKLLLWRLVVSNTLPQFLLHST